MPAVASSFVTFSLGPLYSTQAKKQGRRTVWESDGASSNVVGIICPQVEESAKIWRGEAIVFKKQAISVISGFFQEFLALFEIFTTRYSHSGMKFEFSDSFWPIKPL